MADETKLVTLFDKVAEVLIDQLNGQQLPDYEDEEGTVVKGATLAPSAAMVTASIQFLKNNNITCTPSEDNKLGELEQKMKDRRAKREKRATGADLAGATADMNWLDGRVGGHA